MIFRLFELYSQGKELRQDPIGFGAGIGRDALAPMFIIPAILLAVGSLGVLALWWWIGWGVFLFVSILFALGLLVVHGMYWMTSKVVGRVESSARNKYDEVRMRGHEYEYSQKSGRGSTVIDTTSHE